MNKGHSVCGDRVWANSKKISVRAYRSFTTIAAACLHAQSVSFNDVCSLVHATPALAKLKTAMSSELIASADKLQPLMISREYE
jgi:hypothetical protein